MPTVPTAPVRPLIGTLHLPVFASPVEIVTTPDGAPHVEARSTADLLRAQGLLHYSERRWQIDVGARVAQGTCAALLGEAGLASDRLARALGAPGWVEAAVDAMPDDVHERLRWYAEGAKAAATVVPTTAEHLALGVVVEPPTTQDVIRTAVSLFFGLGLQLQRDWLLDVVRSAQDGSDTHPVSAVALLEAIGRHYGDVLPTGPLGSNAWAVPPTHSTTDAPILAADPHLDTRVPGHWMAMHLTCPELDVLGATIPGVPDVVLGHNGRVAWAPTHARATTGALTLERVVGRDCVARPDRVEPVRTLRETIVVAGAADRTMDVSTTSSGALLGLRVPGTDGAMYDLALDCSWWRDPYPGEALAGLARSSTVAMLAESLRTWRGLPQSLVAADVEGTVAAVEVGSTMAGGGTLRRGWEAVDRAVPSPRHAVHRTDGPVVAANDRPEGSLEAGHWEAPLRRARIDELLAGGQVTPEDCVRAQLDVHSATAAMLLPALIPAVDELADAAQRDLLAGLDAWHWRMARDLIEPTIWAAWVHELVLLTWAEAPVVARTVLETRAWVTEWGMRRLQQDVEAASRTQDGRVRLHGAFARAVHALVDRWGADPAGWLWGRQHVVVHGHELTGHPAWGQPPIGLPQPGFDDTVCVGDGRARPRSGPSFRLVVTLDRPDEAVWAFPVGNSGAPASPHYQDRVDAWRHGRYSRAPFSREAVRSSGGRLLRIVPGMAEQGRTATAGTGVVS